MKVAINGFGRIGRNVFKAGLEKGINFVAINDLTDIDTLAYLLKYDSVFGNYNRKIIVKKDGLIVGNKKIKVFALKNPEELPWGKLGVDVVVESTGLFRRKEDAEKHLKAGAKRVIISAPSESADITVVLGVNQDKVRKSHKVLSMASCTTNCLAPLLKVLDDTFGVKNGFMTTVHGYTSSQAIVDGPARKLRRGRAAALSIVPSSSGATKATTLAIPRLKGKLDGLALRVPIPDGSITDFVGNVKKDVTVDKINAAFKKASNGKLRKILGYTEDEIVSRDIIGNPLSCLIDGKSTKVIGKRLVKVLAWYDNEWGYSNRMADFIKFLVRR